jgi:zinc protease
MMGGGAGLNSRLAERIRQKDGLSYGIGSGLNVPSQDRAGSWSVNGIAAPQNLAKVEAAFFDEINKALKNGFTQEEIDRAKTGALQLRQQQRAQDRSLAGAWTSNLYLNRTFAFTKAQDERIKALTKAEIDAAFRKYIIPAKITVIKAGDEVKAKTASAPANLNPADKR